MVRVAICDDDIHFASKLEEEIIEISKHTVIDMESEIYYDGTTLLDSIRKKQLFDIIFIDIEMKQMDGITTVRHIRKLDYTSLLIFVSGYEQYLKELFEVEPFRFLSKPLDKELLRRYFLDACQRARASKTFFEFSYNKEICRHCFKDIVYFESRNRIIHIFLNDGSTKQFYSKLNEVEEDIKNYCRTFLRIHQSFLVNYDYIKRINLSSLVICFGGKEIELKISEERQGDVKKWLNDHAYRKAVIK